MVKLEKKNGRVTGVIAENADGKYVRYNAAKGVVVATGGYAQNWKMMEASSPGTSASSAAPAPCPAPAATASAPASGPAPRWTRRTRS